VIKNTHHGKCYQDDTGDQPKYGGLYRVMGKCKVDAKIGKQRISCLSQRRAGSRSRQSGRSVSLIR
jgi:hypothetical protein